MTRRTMCRLSIAVVDQTTVAGDWNTNSEFPISTKPEMSLGKTICISSTTGLSKDVGRSISPPATSAERMSNPASPTASADPGLVQECGSSTGTSLPANHLSLATKFQSMIRTHVPSQTLRNKLSCADTRGLFLASCHGHPTALCSGDPRLSMIEISSSVAPDILLKVRGASSATARAKTSTHQHRFRTEGKALNIVVVSVKVADCFHCSACRWVEDSKHLHQFLRTCPSTEPQTTGEPSTLCRRKPMA